MYFQWRMATSPSCVYLSPLRRRRKGMFLASVHSIHSAPPGFDTVGQFMCDLHVCVAKLISPSALHRLLSTCRHLTTCSKRDGATNFFFTNYFVVNIIVFFFHDNSRPRDHPCDWFLFSTAFSTKIPLKLRFENSLETAVKCPLTQRDIYIDSNCTSKTELHFQVVVGLDWR